LRRCASFSSVKLRLVAVAGWLLSLMVVGWSSVRVSDALAPRIASGLSAFLPAFAPRYAEPEPAARPVSAAREPNLEGRSVPEPAKEKNAASARRLERAHRRGGASKAHVEHARETSPQNRGIRVSAESVLRLANNGARPRGTPVKATKERPAGLELHGVGALGLGLRDGDVLTHAGGRPARSEADVVAMILASRGARAPEISGRFYRDGVAWNLVVEQPYLNRPSGIAVEPVVNRRNRRPVRRKVAALR